MKKMLLSIAALPCLLTGFHVSASADDGINVLSNVKFSGEIRPRYESADSHLGTDSTRDAAKAFTTRTTIGVGADLFQVDGLSAYLEGTSVNNFGYTDYNAGGTGINLNTKYDLIKDPQQARITQAYID